MSGAEKPAAWEKLYLMVCLKGHRARARLLVAVSKQQWSKLLLDLAGRWLSPVLCHGVLEERHAGTLEFV